MKNSHKNLICDGFFPYFIFAYKHQRLSKASCDNSENHKIKSEKKEMNLIKNIHRVFCFVGATQI